MIDKGSFKLSLARYLAIAGVYLVCLVALKVVEFFALEGSALGSGKILVNALVVNIIVASWTVLCIGVLYCLIQLLSQKAARVVAAVLYALLLLAEVRLRFIGAYVVGIGGAAAIGLSSGYRLDRLQMMTAAVRTRGHRSHGVRRRSVSQTPPSECSYARLCP